MLRYVLINKPTGHHPAAPLGGFPQEASRGPSGAGRDRSLETVGARLLLWKTTSLMPEANPCQKASFTPTPILTSFFPNVPILRVPCSPIRRSPEQQYYQHAPQAQRRPPAPVLILPRGRPEERRYSQAPNEQTPRPDPCNL